MPQKCQQPSFIRSLRGAQVHFDFALSAIGMVSRSLRDMTMSCVAALYFLKRAVSRWVLYASLSAYISNTVTWVGLFLSDTEYRAKTPGSNRTESSTISLAAAL